MELAPARFMEDNISIIMSGELTNLFWDADLTIAYSPLTL